MAKEKELKNIFLSASIPLPERDAKYIESADIIAIRDAVIALTTTILPKHRLVWGGHPSITPLIYYVMDKLKMDIQNHVTLYQSKFFEEFFLKDNDKFNNVILTNNIDNDREKSLKYMRDRMFSESDFSAGVFMGGMEGVEDEYELFVQKHPNAIIIPVVSTGAATKIIYETVFPEKLKNDRFVKDYGYMALFQKYLMEKI